MAPYESAAGVISHGNPTAAWSLNRFSRFEDPRNLDLPLFHDTINRLHFEKYRFIYFSSHFPILVFFFKSNL